MDLKAYLDVAANQYKKWQEVVVPTYDETYKVVFKEIMDNHGISINLQLHRHQGFLMHSQHLIVALLEDQSKTVSEQARTYLTARLNAENEQIETYDMVHCKTALHRHSAKKAAQVEAVLAKLHYTFTRYTGFDSIAVWDNAATEVYACEYLIADNNDFVICKWYGYPYYAPYCKRDTAYDISLLHPDKAVRARFVKLIKEQAKLEDAKELLAKAG